MSMSVYKKQTSAVFTPGAATPKGHITATVTQGTLARDETVNEENPLIPSKVGSRSFMRLTTFSKDDLNSNRMIMMRNRNK